MLLTRLSGMVLDRFNRGVVPSWSGKEIVVWLKGNEGRRLGFDKDGDDIIWCFCCSSACCWGNEDGSCGTVLNDLSMLPFLWRDSFEEAVDGLRRNEAEKQEMDEIG